jgi:hypothetical protein
MTLNPTYQSSTPRRLAVALALMLAAAVGGSYVSSAKATSPLTQATVCKCVHCPGGALCCCHDSACAPH